MPVVVFVALFFLTQTQFLTVAVSTGSLFAAIGQFLLIFGGSTAIGVAFGLWSALLFKWTRLFNHVLLEGALIMLFAYSSYLLADGIRLSGIVSVLFCGIVMAHYTFSNLSAKVLGGDELHVFLIWLHRLASLRGKCLRSWQPSARRLCLPIWAWLCSVSVRSGTDR